jgi:putative Mn2+ efflux pump MntP
MLFGSLQGFLLAAGVGLAALLHGLLDAATQSPGMMQRWICRLDAVCVHHYVHLGLSLAGATILCIVGAGLMRNYYRRDSASIVYYKGRMALLLLAFSVSIDAFSAGIGLGMLENQALAQVCLTVTLVIALMAFSGLKAGRRIGRLMGYRAELVGGILLVLLAIHLTLQVVLW